MSYLILQEDSRQPVLPGSDQPTILMSPIFISYRREDGIATAELLQTYLIDMFGEDAAFLDTKTMKPGDEFTEDLVSAVTKARVVIALIGPNWRGSNPETDRLANVEDWVRKELELALADRTKRIIPALVKGASLPDTSSLPESLRRLTGFNTIELRENNFRQDILSLRSDIERFVPVSDPLKDLPLGDNYTYPPGSPFKGLDYFTENDARLFFGRGADIKRLYNKIKNRSIVLLYGPSGCGKSSLLFAGLKPRMQYQGWTIQYLRREAGANLAIKLKEYISVIDDGNKHLIILDQVEEIFTSPNPELPTEAEMHQLLASVREASDKIKVILGFRKEYLAEIKKAFEKLAVDEIYLEPLNTTGVLEAIQGITRSAEARDIYELEFADEKTVAAIAQSVMVDESSHIAPLLQVLLRKMWDKVEHKHPRVFDRALLEEVKSNNMAGFIEDQVDAMKQSFTMEVESGLVLDLLYFFTTARDTSASHTREAILAHYEKPDILTVVEELRNKYLLSDVVTEVSKPGSIRLAHDSLGPVIHEEYARSNRPAQRAARILQSKKNDIEMGVPVEFTQSDITVLDASRMIMRKLTNAENDEVERNRQRIKDEKIEKEQLAELKKREDKRIREEQAEIDSIKIRLNLNDFSALCEPIKSGHCTIIMGDKLLSTKDGIPLLRASLSRIASEHPEIIHNDRTNLITFSPNEYPRYHQQSVRKKLLEELKHYSYNIDILQKLSLLPARCYLNFSYDNFLGQVFQRQQNSHVFGYYSEENYGNTLSQDYDKTAFIYNMLGSLENRDFPITDKQMNNVITGIQNENKLPVQLRYLLNSTRSILFLGVNWDAWYVQTLTRYVLNNCGESDHDYSVYFLTTNDNITLEGARFLKNERIMAVDMDQYSFVSRIVDYLQENNALRKATNTGSSGWVN